MYAVRGKYVMTGRRNGFSIYQFFCWGKMHDLQPEILLHSVNSFLPQKWYSVVLDTEHTFHGKGEMQDAYRVRRIVDGRP